jgi:hypothetical protein
MMVEDPSKPRNEMLVQAFREFGAQAHGKVPLVCEGSGRTHQLLKIGLDKTDILIAHAVDVDLTNVVQGRVRLVAIAGTELKEQGIADCGKRQLQDLGVDLNPQCHTTGAGVCQSKTCWLKLHWAVLKCSVKNLSLDIRKRECSKVRGTIKGH